MSWHLDGELLRRYASGGTDLALTMSVEAHLNACASCRDAVGKQVADSRRSAGWTQVLARIEKSPSRRFSRLADKNGVEALWRTITVAPTLRAPWFVGVFICLLVAVLEAVLFDPSATAFVLAAPLLPVVGAAAAYGPALNPSYEVALATPFDGFKLLMSRVVLTLASTAVVTTFFSLIVGGAFGSPTTWLVPAIALTAGTLALTTLVTPSVASGLICVLWIFVVIGTKVASASTVLTSSKASVVFACAAVLCTALVVARKRAFEKGVEAWLATRYRLTA